MIDEFEDCPACDGTGFLAGGIICVRCAGAGEIAVEPPDEEPVFVPADEDPGVITPGY